MAMTDDELDEYFRQVNRDMIEVLNRHVDTEGNLRKLLTKAGYDPDVVMPPAATSAETKIQP